MCERRPGGGKIRVKVVYQSLYPKVLLLVITKDCSTAFPFFIGVIFCGFLINRRFRKLAVFVSVSVCLDVE